MSRFRAAVENVIRHDPGYPAGVSEADMGERETTPELEIDAVWEASWLQNHVYEVQEVMGEPTRERRSVALEALMERMATKWQECTEDGR